MLGSDYERDLIEGRKIVWRTHSLGRSLPEFMYELNEFMKNYAGDTSTLRIGYWDYGGEIVVTAPEEASVKQAM